MLLPASPYTETNYVQCGDCGELFVSRVSVFKLPINSATDVMQFLTRRVPLVPMTLAVCGILLVFVPVIGLGVNLISLLMNWRRRRHWTRKLSLLGTALSLALTVLLVLLFFMLLLFD